MRSRRIVSRPTLRVLRLLGWRWSAHRGAWVHRLGGGRRGPVFRTRQEAADLAASAASDAAVVALPFREEPIDLRDRPIDRAPAAGPQLIDEADHDEFVAPPVVDGGPGPTADAPPGPRVDGRPPRRTDPLPRRTPPNRPSGPSGPAARTSLVAG